MDLVISGIQQIGIGVPDVQEAWKWYREHFGMDIRIFEDKTVAELMLPYTGGEPRKRHAALALNLQGGGGFEIWQYSERTPQAPAFDIKIGDLGIFAAKIKSHDVKKAYEKFKSKNLTILGGLEKDPHGEEHFFVQDPYGNIFQIIKDTQLFRWEKKVTGATAGAIIGVSDIDASMKVYSDILGYDKIVYDAESNFRDLSMLNGGDARMRRVLLKSSKEWEGSFSKLFGHSYIELVQLKEEKPRKIYEDRFWGDLGFIHLCYDIRGMAALKEKCDKLGFSFTVDSRPPEEADKSFDMGEAAGHFSYIEDPDGTLIEFVETHRIPIFKKLGLYLNLKKKKANKNVPNWIIKALRLGRIKD